MRVSGVWENDIYDNNKMMKFEKYVRKYEVMSNEVSVLESGDKVNNVVGKEVKVEKNKSKSYEKKIERYRKWREDRYKNRNDK